MVSLGYSMDVHFIKDKFILYDESRIGRAGVYEKFKEIESLCELINQKQLLLYTTESRGTNILKMLCFVSEQ